MADNPGYNYAAFPPESDAEDFARFLELLPVGRPAPDFEAVRLEDGARLRLSELLAAGTLCPGVRSIT